MKNYDWQDIKQAALGQWPEILQAFGVPYRAKEKNGPCPLCGGHDRSHMKNSGGKVMLYCRHCGNTWADELLLQLSFNNDFAMMCKELGDYLHCQPAERQQMVKSQAVVAEAANTDLAEAQQKMDKAAEITGRVVKIETHSILMRYGIGADCYADEDITGAMFPMKIDGHIVDWLVVGDSGQRIASGRLASGAKLVIKPEQPGNKIFVTADLVDAYHLYQVGRQKNITICCGTLRNLQKVCDALPEKYTIIAAIKNSLEGLEAMQTMSQDFIMPDESGRKFCEIDYRYKPDKIYSNADAGQMYLQAIEEDEK